MRNGLARASPGWSVCPKPGDRGAQVRFRCVPEFLDERMAFERLLHDAALDAFSAAVNQSDFTESGGMCGIDVVLDNRPDVARRKRMQIERVFYGNLVGVFGLQLSTFRFRHEQGLPAADVQALASGAVAESRSSYEAVTTVLMPPRTEKSPTTVIRRGRHAETRSSRI